MGTKNKIFIAALIIILIIFLLIGMTQIARAATVPDGHVGIVVKWGKARNEVLSPGFYFTAPWTSIKKMDCRWQKYELKTSAFSKDIQQVDVQMSMSYQLHADGALEMYRTVGLDYADKIMMPRLLDALKSTFAKYSAEELVNKRQEISIKVYDMLREDLLNYAITVKEVAIEDIDFTDVFTDAIEAKQVATQKKLQVQTEQEQATIVAKAEAERATINAQAEAEKIRIRAEAEAEAVRIAADAEAYRLEQENKHITEYTIRKQTVEKWNGQLPTITSDGTPIIDFRSIGNE